MFGHQDDQPQDNTDATFPPEELLTAGNDSSTISDNTNPAASPTVGAPADLSTPEPDTEKTDLPAPVDLSTLGAPSLSSEPATITPTTAVPDFSAPVAKPAAAPSTDDLLDIKQSALQQLSPLVSQLDQTPEEKFRTTMMMIQAADDQSLIKTAYEAAQQITDEKAKAQALLDIVNEINYFTQHQD